VPPAIGDGVELEDHRPDLMRVLRLVMLNRTSADLARFSLQGVGLSGPSSRQNPFTRLCFTCRCSLTKR